MRKSPLKNRLLSLAVVFCFLATNLNLPVARGEKGTGGNSLPASFSTNSGQPQGAAPTLDIAVFYVPGKIGKNEETFKGNSKQTVILVRDAHSIPEAKKNIQEIIGYFQKKYGIHLIGAEGADGELDAQVFRSFPDKKKLKEVFGETMERGELTGVNAAAVFEPSVGAAPRGRPEK